MTQHKGDWGNKHAQWLQRVQTISLGTTGRFLSPSEIMMNSQKCHENKQRYHKILAHTSKKLGGMTRAKQKHYCNCQNLLGIVASNSLLSSYHSGPSKSKKQI